jgi:SpoVK/Ycf46/Vps4 family AAA+-type ATPase
MHDIYEERTYYGGEPLSVQTLQTLHPGNRFEAQYARRCVVNALTVLRKRSAQDGLTELFLWLCDHHAALGFKLGASMKDLWAEGKKLGPAWSGVAEALLAVVARDVPVPPSAFENRLRWIAATTKLSGREAAILKIVVRSLVHPLVGSIATRLSGGRAEDEINARVIATLLNLPLLAVRNLLARKSPLIQFGLLEDRRGGDVAPTGLIMRLARCRFQDHARLCDELFGCPRKSTLDSKDFDHLGEPRRTVASLVAATLERHEPGVGILFYGPPGTGKTEYAKVLAAEVGASAVFIGEADDDGNEPSRSERIAHLTLTSALADKAGRTLLVVDEADDLFTGVDEDDRVSRTGSKVFMNRLVERCMAPTIWITNNPERLGPAMMRRMAFAIRFPEPGRAVRRGMVERIAAKRRLKLDTADLDRLECIPAAPALIDAGLRAASLTGGGVEATIACTESLLAALGSRRPEPLAAGLVPFDPALSAADCDLVALGDRVRACFAVGEKALSFCFHGIPGTGKSAYARFLAERIGLEVVEKRASDILSCWLGETEQNIAAAFRDAADRGAMLVIDEADSLLQDRTGAQRSWEVTQVNEMLTWIERHPYPLVCTTNTIDVLDRATLRRFVFKVEFLPMTAAQARDAFRRAFGIEPPLALDHLDPLTPGDFAVVARKVKVMRESDPYRLAAMLAAEVAAKQRGAKRRIGF